MQSTDKLRLELGQVIGADYYYVTSKDHERHFDALAVVEGYAIFLFFTFAKAAATRLKEHVEEAVKKAGVKVADLIWNALKRAVQIKSTPEGNAQPVAELEKAAPDVQELLRAMDAKQKEVFLAAGQLAVKNKLIADGFPGDVAETKAKQFIDVIQSQLK